MNTKLQRKRGEFYLWSTMISVGINADLINGKILFHEGQEKKIMQFFNYRNCVNEVGNTRSMYKRR